MFCVEIFILFYKMFFVLGSNDNYSLLLGFRLNKFMADVIYEIFRKIIGGTTFQKEILICHLS